MSMLENFKPRNRDNGAGLPRASTVQPGVPMRAPTHEDYADEAMRARQRHLDMVSQIDTLVAEVEQWRSRALVAEGECQRLEKRELEMREEMKRKADDVNQELDAHKRALTA